jgi:hypothetical protein
MSLAVEIFKAAIRRAWEHRRSEPGDLHPMPVNPCEMVLSLTPRSNGRRLRVRCRCMAEYKASRRHYAYDWLADVSGLEAARAVWDAHVIGRKRRDQ